MMIDNKLRSVFDSVSPTKEQKDRMFSKILSSTQKEKIHMTKFTGMLSICAAALLVVTSVYVYNTVFLPKTDDIVTETKVIQNTIDEKTGASDNNTDNVAINDSIDKSKIRSTDNDVDISVETYGTSDYTSDVSEESISQTEMLNDSFNQKLLFNDFSLFSVGSKNTVMMKEYNTERASGGGSSAAASPKKEKTYQNIQDEYFSSIGYNFTDYIALPDDFTQTDTENTDLSSLKDCVFTYNGNNGRSLTVTISPDRKTFDEHLNNDDILKNIISDNDVVLFSDDNVYGGYFVKGNYVYKLFANLISEAEFIDIISSIA